jgi:hypothetical protein
METRECCDMPINAHHAELCDNKRCLDCGAFVNKENHHSTCPIILKLNESFRQDGNRWREGYGYMSASAVRGRVLAHNATLNGGG